jgi:hypothetical protein
MTRSRVRGTLVAFVIVAAGGAAGASCAGPPRPLVVTPVTQAEPAPRGPGALERAPELSFHRSGSKAQAGDAAYRATLDRDEVEKLVLRVDNEARAARLHSSTSGLSAEAAARHADEALAGVAPDARLEPVGAELAARAEELKSAAGQGDWVAVDAKSEEVQDAVRRLDEQLPPPTITPSQ